MKQTLSGTRRKETDHDHDATLVGVRPALPAIGPTLHARLSDLEWTVNASTLVFTIGMIQAAGVGDRFEYRLVLLSGVALFVRADPCAVATCGGRFIGVFCTSPMYKRCKFRRRAD